MTTIAPPHQNALVRPVRHSDFDAVGRVAYQTGFFGREASTYFPDPLLFADIWVGPYFDHPSTLGFVTEQAGRVTGYILGLPDGAAYGQAITRAILRRILPNLLRGRYRRPLAGVRYLLRFWRTPGQHAPTTHYPAHLHINLLPATRGQGLGAALLTRYLNALHAQGVPGVQLSTTRENGPAIRLYQRLGFHVWAEWESTLWTPWLGRPATHVVMVRTLP